MSGTAPVWLRFRVGAAGAALPLGLVREIMRCPPIVPVPGSHPQVAGVVLSGGMALPVYDLVRFDPLWSRPNRARRETSAEPAHLIVCRWGEILVGVLGDQVDLLAGPEQGESSEAFEGPGELRGEFVSGVLRCQGEMVSLIDPAALFASLGVPAELNTNRHGGTREEDLAGR